MRSEHIRGHLLSLSTEEEHKSGKTPATRHLCVIHLLGENLLQTIMHSHRKFCIFRNVIEGTVVQGYEGKFYTGAKGMRFRASGNGGYVLGMLCKLVLLCSILRFFFWINLSTWSGPNLSRNLLFPPNRVTGIHLKYPKTLILWKTKEQVRRSCGAIQYSLRIRQFVNLISNFEFSFHTVSFFSLIEHIFIRHNVGF